MTSAFILTLLPRPSIPSHQTARCLLSIPSRTTLHTRPHPTFTQNHAPLKLYHVPVSRLPSPKPPLSATSPRTLLTVLSTIVGVCVLIGSVLYKIPQVLRVLRRRSAEGISILMYALETIGTTFSAVYFARRAFPFATYGESVFIMAQNVCLMLLIVRYQRLPTLPATLSALAYLLALAVLYSNHVPLAVLMALQVCSIPILNLARVPQILLNWRRKGTGELSPVTLGLQLLGNVARIFTTIAQVRDPLMFVAICVATCFNSTLFIQWLHYSGRLKLFPNKLPNA